jgi:hypothetical protein
MKTIYSEELTERMKRYGNALSDLILSAREEGIELRTKSIEEDPVWDETATGSGIVIEDKVRSVMVFPIPASIKKPRINVFGHNSVEVVSVLHRKIEMGFPENTSMSLYISAAEPNVAVIEGARPKPVNDAETQALLDTTRGTATNRVTASLLASAEAMKDFGKPQKQILPKLMATTLGGILDELRELCLDIGVSEKLLRFVNIAFGDSAFVDANAKYDLQITEIIDTDTGSGIGWVVDIFPQDPAPSNEVPKKCRRFMQVTEGKIVDISLLDEDK